MNESRFHMCEENRMGKSPSKRQNHKHDFMSGLVNHRRYSGTDTVAIERYVKSYKSIKTEVP